VEKVVAFGMFKIASVKEDGLVPSWRIIANSRFKAAQVWKRGKACWRQLNLSVFTSRKEVIGSSIRGGKADTFDEKAIAWVGVKEVVGRIALDVK